jgi:3-hydroxyisobutyrate dehydrogenase
MTNLRIALLGLGTMGAGMAHNLLKAGFPLTVYNRNPAKAAPLAGAGANVADSPSAAAADADIVISMVADDNASRAVWLGDKGDNGVFHGVKPGTLLIESSTLTVEWVNQLAAEARNHGCELIDAPVTGSRNQAAAGELLFLVGGSESALARARPALAVMSRAIVHVGTTGSGALLKLINNFMCAVQAVSLAEAMAMIERSGLDRATALDVLLNGAPGSPMVKTVTARMTARDYVPPYFLLRLMTKDLIYAKKEAAQMGVDLDTATTAINAFQRAIAAGLGEQDLAAVVEPLRAHAD